MRTHLRDLALQSIAERTIVNDATVREARRWCVDEVHRRAVNDPATADFLHNVIPELLRQAGACANEYELCERYSEILEAEVGPWLADLIDDTSDTTRLRMIVIPTGNWEAFYREPFLFFSIGFVYVLKYLSTLVATIAWTETVSEDDARDCQRAPDREEAIAELRQDALSKGLLCSLRSFGGFCLLPDLDAIMPLIDAGWEEGVRSQQQLIFGAMATFVCLHEFGHSMFRGTKAADLVPPPSLAYPETLSERQLGELAADHAAIELSGQDAYVLLGAGILLALLADLEPGEPTLRDRNTHPHSINRLSNIYSAHRESIVKANLEGVYSQPITAFLSGGDERMQTVFARWESWDEATLTRDLFQSMSDLSSITQDDGAMDMYLVRKAMDSAGIRGTDEYSKSCVFCEQWNVNEERCRLHGIAFNGEANTCDEWKGWQSKPDAFPQ